MKNIPHAHTNIIAITKSIPKFSCKNKGIVAPDNGIKRDNKMVCKMESSIYPSGIKKYPFLDGPTCHG